MAVVIGCAIDTENVMDKTTVAAQQTDQTRDRSATSESKPRIDWETPRMEDVSEQVTAQPYIRFT
jgi:hypothetical protein